MCSSFKIKVILPINVSYMSIRPFTVGFGGQARQYLSLKTTLKSLLILCFSVYFLICGFTAQAESSLGNIFISYSEEANGATNLIETRAKPSDTVYIQYKPSTDEPVYRISWFINNQWLGKPKKNILTFPQWPYDLSTLGEGVHKIEARIFPDATSNSYISYEDYFLVTSLTELPQSVNLGVSKRDTSSTLEHYIRVVHSNAREMDSLSAIDNWYDLNSEETIGFVLQLDWADITSDLEQYSFDVIDDALQKKKGSDKIWVKLMDRTFHSGCTDKWYPEGVKVRAGNDNTCFADHTDPNTTAAFQTTVEKLVSHYKSNADIAGFIFNETALQVFNTSEKAVFYERLIRYHNAIYKIAPNKYVIQYLNWPNSYKLFEKFVTNFLTWNNGLGGIGWPDSKPDEVDAHAQYQLAKEYNSKITVFPGAQGALVDLCTNTQSILDMLKGELEVHMIAWEKWAKNCEYPEILSDILYKDAHASSND